VCGEEATADVHAATESCKQKLKYVLRGYLQENKYNADEATFFMRCYQTRKWPIEEKSVPVARKVRKD
jgi:hypothetical protein